MDKKLLSLPGLLLGALATIASVFIIIISIDRKNQVFNANLEALSKVEDSYTCHLQVASSGYYDRVIICNTGVWGTSPFKCMGPDYAQVSSFTATCHY